ncbi:MAG TPA: hypothetical protein VEI53_10970, partial [Ktedonobacteraceae bacterium]|nr:hypothetical protein [Ktedonobacteraceae bacterium]
ADTAQLPLHARQWFMTIAVFLAAIPPLYDTVLELHTLGGYIEIFVLMLLLMIFALQLTNRRAAGASRRELAWRWAAIGFIVGLGLWVNPLILYAVLAAAIWIIIDWIKALRESSVHIKHTNPSNVGTGFAPVLHNPTHVPAWQTFFKTLLLPALASIPAGILGLAPAIYWGALNQWQNITYILQLSGNPPLRPIVQAQYPTRLDIFFGLTHLYATCVGPRILSGALPGENPALRYLHTPTLMVSAFCIATTVAFVVLSFIQPHPLLLAVRKLAALPLVFAISVSVIFCVTETAASGLWSCQYDLAGRYATPLMLVLPFFVATVFVIVILLEAGAYRVHQHRASNDALPRADQDNPLQAHSIPGPGAPLASQAFSSVKSGSSYWKLALALLVASLIVSVYLQVSLYAASDAGSTFQSAFCTNAPANNDAIIAYMEREHIHYAWANNWIAYPIVFKTHENIIISDPLPLIRHIPLLDRIPAYTQAVRNADRPSFLVLVKHDDPYPLMLQYLDIQKIRYNVARFPSQNGRDVLVITPLNRTVSPLDSFFFNVFICSRDG